MQFSNINYNLYKTFVVVYETKNISKAAEFLYISQPAVSHSIKELEKQLGIQLFFKKSNGMTATNEASLLYKYISSAFNSISKGELTISNMTKLKSGIIKVGIPSYLSVVYISQLIADFHKMYPEIKIEVINKPISDLLLMLQTQNIDILINNEPVEYEKLKIEIRYYNSFEHCFFAPVDYPQEKPLCIEDFNNMPLIITNQFSEEVRLLKNAVGNIKINPIIEAGTADSVIKLVKTNHCIGYTQEIYIKDELEAKLFKKLKLTFTPPKLDIYISYILDGMAPAPKQFIEFISHRD